MPNKHDLRWPLGPRPSGRKWIAEMLAENPTGLSVEEIATRRANAGYPKPIHAGIQHGLRRLAARGLVGRRLGPQQPFCVWRLSPVGYDLLKKESNGQSQASGK